ncbi:MAG: hypothetical protein J5939_04215 [Bacteroidales bacterium]|nr:hypothetical protein [Bacteroidales bacterium]
MHPKFIIVSRPGERVGTFVFGLVGSHRELLERLEGYVTVHGGGWYEKDDVAMTMTLYGSSGDFGEPRLCLLDRVPVELKDYSFFFTPFPGIPGNRLDLSEVEWI